MRALSLHHSLTIKPPGCTETGPGLSPGLSPALSPGLSAGPGLGPALSPGLSPGHGLGLPLSSGLGLSPALSPGPGLSLGPGLGSGPRLTTELDADEVPDSQVFQKEAGGGGGFEEEGDIGTELGLKCGEVKVRCVFVEKHRVPQVF